MCFLKVFIYLRVAGAPKTFQSYWTNIKHRCCFSLPVWCFFSMFYRCQSEGSFLLWCQNVHGKSKRWWKGWKLLWTFYPTSTKERDVDATDGSGRKWSPKNVSMEIQGATKMKIIPEAILTWAKHEALPHCHAHSLVYKKINIQNCRRHLAETQISYAQENWPWWNSSSRWICVEKHPLISCVVRIISPRSVLPS